jgi:hypothetical protein
MMMSTMYINYNLKKKPWWSFQKTSLIGAQAPLNKIFIDNSTCWEKNPLCQIETVETPNAKYVHNPKVIFSGKTGFSEVKIIEI